ncbi:MAG: hypothetical protein IK082_01545 [Oscillospiraceae bacterium]|nr:hypothetical protein [Oscillospiraceae bacterium]
MDKVLAFLVLIAVIVLLGAGEIYFSLERRRVKASALMAKIRFDDWLAAVTDMTEACAADGAKIGELSRLLAPGGSKDASVRAGAANRILSLAKQTLSEHTDSAEAVACARRATDAWLAIADLCDRYNHAAGDLNYGLGGKLTGRVGRLFRFEKMERLADLTLL